MHYKITYTKRNFLIGTSLTLLMFLNACQKELPPADALNEENVSEIVKPASINEAAGTSFVPNQVLVKFKKGTSPELRANVNSRVGANVEEHIHTRSMRDAGDNDGLFLMRVPMAVAEAVGRLKNMPEIEYAEPNYIYKHSATSNDPYYTNGSLWGMYGATGSPSNSYGSAAADAWANGNTGSNDVYVAVIDEGIMHTHEDLAANMWINPNDPVDGIDNDGNGYKDDKWGWDFSGNNNSTYDNTGDDHGTHVGGTIGAVGGNNKGVAGVNWKVKIITCKFLGSNGGTTANAIKAVDYVTDLKVRAGINIVATNNSWGGGGYSQGLKDAIDRAAVREILFVAAAGNNGSNNDVTPSYPASYSSSNIIAVAAIGSNGSIASFSQYGASSVDIGAPGVGIYSTLPSSNKKRPFTYGSYSGTSMATPHVTGAVALYVARNGNTTAANIKAAIMGSVSSNSSMSGKCVSGGILNLSGF